LLPLLLTFVDALFQRGAVIEFNGMKLDLSQAHPATPSLLQCQPTSAFGPDP
jgi:hypothetical protein